MVLKIVQSKYAKCSEKETKCSENVEERMLSFRLQAQGVGS